MPNTANECRRCSRKSQTFLCGTCVDNLRTQLRELPWWIDRLVETSLGQVKMSDGGRRAKRTDVLHGDDTLASHIEPYPDESEEDLRKARRQRERIALHHALAGARINGRASEEYDRIYATLARWTRELCKALDIQYAMKHTVPHDFIGPLPAGWRRLTANFVPKAGGLALWLNRHAHDIANRQNADQCCDDIAAITKRIERHINRPIPPRFIGPCITDPAPDELLTARRTRGDHTTRCGTELSANRKAAEVTCPTCHQTYRVDELVAHLYDESGDTLMTIRDLVDWVLPRLEEPVPERTLYRWIKNGAVPIRGHNDAGNQMVRLNDVLRARRDKVRSEKVAG